MCLPASPGSSAPNVCIVARTAWHVAGPLARCMHYAAEGVWACTHARECACVDRRCQDTLSILLNHHPWPLLPPMLCRSHSKEQRPIRAWACGPNGSCQPLTRTALRPGGGLGVSLVLRPCRIRPHGNVLRRARLAGGPPQEWTKAQRVSLGTEAPLVVPVRGSRAGQQGSMATHIYCQRWFVCWHTFTTQATRGVISRVGRVACV